MKKLHLVVSDEFFDQLKKASKDPIDDIGYTLYFNVGKMDNIRYDFDASSDEIYADCIFNAWAIMPTAGETIRNFIRRKDEEEKENI
jgi:hypothetical protein